LKILLFLFVDRQVHFTDHMRLRAWIALSEAIWVSAMATAGCADRSEHP